LARLVYGEAGRVEHNVEALATFHLDGERGYPAPSRVGLRFVGKRGRSSRIAHGMQKVSSRGLPLCPNERT
jgi:hypothetical protein